MVVQVSSVVELEQVAAQGQENLVGTGEIRHRIFQYAAQRLEDLILCRDHLQNPRVDRDLAAESRGEADAHPLEVALQATSERGARFPQGDRHTVVRPGLH